MISNKFSLCKKGFKYFIGYKDHEKVDPLCIMFQEMSGYPKCFDETKYIRWKTWNARKI